MPSYGLINGDVVEMRLVYQLFGQTCINTWHFAIGTGTPTDGDLADLVDAVEDEYWVDALQPLLSHDVDVVTWQAQTVYPLRKITLEQAAVPATGGKMFDASPPTTAVVLKKQTILAGAKNRGRVFVAGIPFSDTIAGTVEATVLLDWNTVASNFGSVITFGTREATPVIYSTATHVINGDVIGGSADFVLRVQRRREIGKGI